MNVQQKYWIGKGVELGQGVGREEAIQKFKEACALERGLDSAVRGVTRLLREVEQEYGFRSQQYENVRRDRRSMLVDWDAAIRASIDLSDDLWDWWHCIVDYKACTVKCPDLAHRQEPTPVVAVPVPVPVPTPTPTKPWRGIPFPLPQPSVIEPPFGVLDLYRPAYIEIDAVPSPMMPPHIPAPLPTLPGAIEPQAVPRKEEPIPKLPTPALPKGAGIPIPTLPAGAGFLPSLTQLQGPIKGPSRFGLANQAITREESLQQREELLRKAENLLREVEALQQREQLLPEVGERTAVEEIIPGVPDWVVLVGGVSLVGGAIYAATR